MKPTAISIFTFLVFFTSAKAQQLFNDQIDIIPGKRVTYRAAVIYLPPNYSKTKKYPLVIFTHGIGESGKNINKLYRTGLPKVLKDGYRPSFDFIMIAPQHASFSAPPDWLPGILEDAERRWHIDTNRIYLTGLSAGGQAVYGSQLNISPEFAKKFAAIVINSGVTGGVRKTNLDWWKRNKTPLWAIVGAADKNYAHQNTYMVDEINKRVPGLATLTIRPGVGHGKWDDVYDGKIKINNKTMWEWMYQFTRASKNFPATTTSGNDTGGTDTGGTDTHTSGETKYIKVNIYSGVNPFINSEWNNWNVGLGYRSYINSRKFDYSDGTNSTIQAQLTESDNVNDNYADYRSGMAPGLVLRYDSYSRDDRSLKISGLKPSANYTIELYSSRIRSNNRTVFKINNQTQTIKVKDNFDKKAVFNNIKPDARGYIVIEIKSADMYNYLNGFTIIENGKKKKNNDEEDD